MRQIAPTSETTSAAWREIERRVRHSLTAWRDTLAGDMAEARQGSGNYLTGPILFTPFVDDRGRRGLAFEGRVGLEAILSGTVVTKLASPTGFEPVFWP